MYSSDQKSKKSREQTGSAKHTLYLNISRLTSTEKKSNREGSAEYEGAKVNLGFDNKEESASRENQDQRKTHPTSHQDYEVMLYYLTK